MQRRDWIGTRNRKLVQREKRAMPLARLTIAELEKKIGTLNTRIKNGSDTVLFMRTTLDPRANIADALLGQLKVERTNYQDQLEKAIIWKDAGWEE